ncbi:EpsG family protein [[Flexibacter] sp. ATCC 35103]|uniref:EpsG family protein n=1 Tax=[Flexibacter] sp. ATCC 35103 TaxID=1937528 RepID=UPI0009CFAC45|nr:EpsG family protein [[Flexibacter] sp. ATCC 35103]OMQ09849.1 hypothetical protein BXU01_15820 [[Flexibacter] sp. ATCC 35103]
MIYILIFFILLLFTTISLYNSKLRYILYFLSVFILIIFGSLRWETGADWIPYNNFFLLNDSLDKFLEGGFEIGFAYLNYFVKSFSDSYSVMLFVVSSIALLSKSIFVLKKSDNIVFVIFGFYCFFLGDSFPVRQAMAVGILLASTIFIIDRKKIFFLLCVCLAATIHVTSLFFIFAYPIFHLKWSNKKIIYLFLVCIFIGFIKLPIVILSKLSNVGDLGFVTAKLLYYLEDGADQNTLDNPINFIVSLIRRLLVFTPLFLCRKRCEAYDPNYNGYLNLLCFGNAIFFAFCTSIEVFIRMGAYFYIYEIFLLAIILKVYWPTKAGSWVYLLLILYFCIKLYGALSAYWDLYVPYYSIFEYVPRSMH